MAATSFPRQWADRQELVEAEQVLLWRFQTARHAGLSREEAELFATGDGNTAALRHAAEHGATHDQLIHIFVL